MNNLINILVKIPFNSNQAIVFDIDDTLISSKTNRLIPNIFNFYQYCINHNYNVYIITARAGTIHNMNATIQQLQYLGITRYFWSHNKSNPSANI